ncbi:M48 family metalloprotease [Hyphococcus flavus]|uniref:M48 family metalloprotease n=1 Tax=Hyphococcus flavus TaxID=1866326 RepID=A0AAE9ZDY8_9PROT|nr:M48 family metalloprotease [Hyphococcus flavus]WDI30767.1 M48 family metalloprotease [Hyphococcus flavus]
MGIFNSTVRTVLAGLAGLALAACASTGGPLGLSPQQEQALGQQQHPQILAAFGGEVDDPQLRAYVERVFNRLMATDPTLPAMNIYVLDSPVINAMAVPGHVYVTRGLLALANSEAELAGVIGHEIGHNQKRHIAKRVSRSNLAQLGTVAAAILTGDESTAQAIGQGAQLYLLNYSRDQEYESDLVGTRLLASSGYDPLGAAFFLNTLGAWTNLEAQIAGVQQPPEYLKTHPNSANRVQRAAQEANALRQAGATSDEVNRNVFLNAIDGMIYGDDPQTQGYIDGRTFIHPQIGIAFTAPMGFQLANSSQAVTGRSASGAQMQFSAASSDKAPSALIEQELSQALGVNLAPARSGNINNRPAAMGRARANTNSGAVDVTAYVIRWQGTTNYVFLWVTPANQTGQMERALQQSVESLRTVNAQSLNVPDATRIDVITAQSGDTARGLSRYMAFPSYQFERFAIMNGLDSDAAVRSGERYKLVR